MTSSEREELIISLTAASFGTARLQKRLRLFYKKTAWNTVVGASIGLKRILDIVFSVVFLAALAPVFIAVGIAIKLTDGGPILFWQTRVGQFGKVFSFPKFRSMVVNAESIKEQLMDKSHHAEGVTFKMKNDPRVTWIGRIIRKLSIDELPQFWCVLKGEMSLVGPRPPVEKEVVQYSIADRKRFTAPQMAHRL